MTIDKIETVRTLLKYTGKDNAQRDAVIRGAVAILEGCLAPEEVAVPAKPAPKAPKAKKRTTKFDMGKLGALRKAGWTVPKIADEMGVSEATVYNHLKELEKK